MSRNVNSGGRDSSRRPWEEAAEAVRNAPTFEPPIQELWRLTEMFLSNADRVSWNPEHQWDPESVYETGYMERGAPEWLAKVLGVYSRTAEPDLIGLLADLAFRAPKAAKGLAQVASPPPRTPPDPSSLYHPVMTDDGLRTTVYRAQGRGGTGPYTSTLPGDGYARYATDSPQAMAQLHGGPRTTTFSGDLRARPHGFLDATGAFDLADPVLMDRMRQALSQFDDGGFMLRSLDNYQRGAISGADFIKDLQRVVGDNLGTLPGQIGLDVARVPHNLNSPPVRAPGSEYILFNRDAVGWNNAYDHPEFLKLFGLGR
jgi:hypothetical protein